MKTFSKGNTNGAVLHVSDCVRTAPRGAICLVAVDGVQLDEPRWANLEAPTREPTSMPVTASMPVPAVKLEATNGFAGGLGDFRPGGGGGIQPGVGGGGIQPVGGDVGVRVELSRDEGVRDFVGGGRSIPGGGGGLTEGDVHAPDSTSRHPQAWRGRSARARTSEPRFIGGAGLPSIVPTKPKASVLSRICKWILEGYAAAGSVGGRWM